MNRLIWITIAMCALLSACGGGTNVEDPKDTSSPLLTETEQAVLGGVTPVDERISQALDPNIAPEADILPALPGVELSERSVSEAHNASLNGADYYSGMKSANAVVEGTGLNITAEAGALGWAVYQIALEPGAKLTKLTIQASDGDFPAYTPGYWVGFANYSSGMWSDFAQKNTTASPYVKTLNLATADYLSPNNNLYIAILTDGQATGQSFTIDSLSLDYDLADWEHIEFGESFDNAGWTPALAFTHGAGSLMIVYSDYATGYARYGVWDPAGDFSTRSSWAFMDVDPLRTDTPDVAGSTCKWLDMTQDPTTGYPRISLIYDGVTGGDSETIIGLSVYVKGATALFLNYRLGSTSGMYINGGGYTSVDRDPVDGSFVVAHYVSNDGWAPPDDMHLRVFQLNEPNNYEDDEPIIVTKNFATLFGIPCYNPHVRCMPDQSYVFSINGGYMYQYYGDTYTDYLADSNSNALGSVADSGQTKGWGFAYAKQSGTQTILRFVEDLENVSAPIHDVDTVSSSNWIGASQLAYKSDGNPGIAYTVFNGSGIDVRLAEYDGSAWTIETVSTTPCTPADTTDREAVLVDLDYNIEDTPAVIWNQVNGTTCVAHVARRPE